MQRPPRLQKSALSVTRWLGSPQSIIVHTVLFVLSFVFTLIGFVSFDRMLLVLTTVVSLEAIYLALFIQMTVNYAAEAVDATAEDIEEIQEDVEEIQKDVDEIQEDVEEITEEEIDDGHRDAQQQKTLDQIQTDLRKLMDDIDRLRSNTP